LWAEKTKPQFGIKKQVGRNNVGKVQHEKKKGKISFAKSSQSKKEKGARTEKEKGEGFVRRGITATAITRHEGKRGIGR